MIVEWKRERAKLTSIKIKLSKIRLKKSVLAVMVKVTGALLLEASYPIAMADIALTKDLLARLGRETLLALVEILTPIDVGGAFQVPPKFLQQLPLDFPPPRDSATLEPTA